MPVLLPDQPLTSLDEYIDGFCSAMAEAGADQICLYDGSSGLGHEAWAWVITRVKQAAPACEIGRA